MSEPVSLADIKTHLRLDPSGTDEDVYLTSLIVAARRSCELKIGRAIVDRTLTVVLDRFPALKTNRNGAELRDFRPNMGDISLPGGTVIAVSVDYFDADGASQTLDPTTYFADLAEEPARLRPVDSWPEADDRPGAVVVSYDVSALDSDDLEVARQAMRLAIGTWYTNREGAVADVRGVPAEIPLAVSWLLEGLISYGGR